MLICNINVYTLFLNIFPSQISEQNDHIIGVAIGVAVACVVVVVVVATVIYIKYYRYVYRNPGILVISTYYSLACDF